jgi:hypothetical protein
MWIDKNNFEDWMRRIMERFDRLESESKKTVENPKPVITGEKMFDNQDLCMMMFTGIQGVCTENLHNLFIAWKLTEEL